MALNRIIRIKLEEADAVGVGVGGLGSIEGSVEEGGVRRAVVSLDELKGIRSETIEGVQVGGARLNRVISYKVLVCERFMGMGWG